MVGAGPTGLALALQAQAHGAHVRVVERRPSVFRPSRALIVHPRTLEVLRPLGVVDDLLARADTAPAAQLHLGRRVVPVRLGRIDLPDTAYPHLTLLRQADVEAVLDRALGERGVQVQRGTELIGISDGGGVGAHVMLHGPDGSERGWYRWVAGCDGADSTVRRVAGIGWYGAGYHPEIVLADLELDGDLAPGVAHVVAGRRGLLFVFALGECATWRLLATRPCTDPALAFGQPGPPVDRSELQHLLDEAGLPARIRGVGWSSRVRVQHRLAATYRRGPLFLAGDAAHTHSPAAAQGMNTGIQDAANLGWKLALAAASTTPEELLDSYDRERRPVARHVLALTHLVFWAEASANPLASFVRGTLAPLAAPAVPVALRRRWPLTEIVRLLARFGENYRRSPISVEAAAAHTGGPRSGDRLPDATVTAGGRDVRLHELIARPGLHVLLSGDLPVPDAPVAAPPVHVHRLTRAPWTGALVVRPDGHIGYRGAPDIALRRWLGRVGAPVASTSEE
ncbi:hypothetical protein GCM10010472_22560 [Pseudonocardia halophobica]|uniref:FAD-binding domain-containing protein n=1 Tax=Pseudonocardia halophobica TaxID=29401 RepID=A0A9W6KXG5_9PSEU|nr:hypothetical protein GCM10017577_06280 [Pseudonocardia halophobica]